MNSYARWYSRLIVLGIAINLFLAIPGMFIPNAVLARLGVEPTRDPMWVAFASSLLVLLSLFYIPAARDPLRNTFSAVLAVLARFSGAIFFLILWRNAIVGARTLGYLDLTLGLIQGILLIAAYRRGPDEE